MDSENSRPSDRDDWPHNPTDGDSTYTHIPDLAWMRGLIAALDAEYPDLSPSQINDLSAMLFKASKYRALAPNLAVIQWQADMDADSKGRT